MSSTGLIEFTIEIYGDIFSMFDFDDFLVTAATSHPQNNITIRIPVKSNSNNTS